MLYACKLCGYLNKEIEVLNHRTWRYSIFHAKPLGLGDWASKLFWKFSNKWGMTMDYHGLISDFHGFPQSKWLVLTRDCGRGTKMKCSQASLDLHIPSQGATARRQRLATEVSSLGGKVPAVWKKAGGNVSSLFLIVSCYRDCYVGDAILCYEGLLHDRCELHCCRHNLVAFTDMRFQ